MPPSVPVKLSFCDAGGACATQVRSDQDQSFEFDNMQCKIHVAVVTLIKTETHMIIAFPLIDYDVTQLSQNGNGLTGVRL